MRSRKASRRTSLNIARSWRRRSPMTWSGEIPSVCGGAACGHRRGDREMERRALSTITDHEWITYEWTEITRIEDCDRYYGRGPRRLPEDAADMARNIDAIRAVLSRPPRPLVEKENAQRVALREVIEMLQRADTLNPGVEPPWTAWMRSWALRNAEVLAPL